MRQLPVLVAVLATAVLVGCGGADAPDAEASTPQAATPNVGQTVTLHPKGDILEYKEKEFTVVSGETVW